MVVYTINPVVFSIGGGRGLVVYTINPVLCSIGGGRGAPLEDWWAEFAAAVEEHRI